MADLYDLTAPQKPTNLSLNSDLLKKARELKVNLSATLDGSRSLLIDAIDFAITGI